MLRKTRNRKVALIIFVLLILFFFSINFIASVILKTVVNKSDTIEVNNASVNVFDGTIELSEVVITNLKVDSIHHADGFINTVRIDHFNLVEYFKERRIRIHLIKVENSQLSFSTSVNPTGQTTRNSSTTVDAVVDSISILHSTLIYVKDSNVTGIVYLQSIATSQFKIPINGDDQFQIPSAFLATADSITVSDSSKMYTFSFYDMEFSNRNPVIKFEKIQILPHYKKSTFADRANFQTDRFSGSISGVAFHCNSFDSLFKSKAISGSIDLQSFELIVYRDKNISRKRNDFKKTVQEYIRGIKVPLKIDSLTVNKGQLNYQEKAEGSNSIGEISFGNIKGRITGLNNTTEKDTLRLHATSVFMASSRLNIDLIFPLKQNYFDCSGQINELPLVQLNEISGPNGGILFSQGVIKKLAFNMRAGAESSNGDLLLEYENLDFAIKNKQNGDTTGVKSKLLSFIVGELIIPPSNPNSSGKLKPGHINYTRDKERFIFNYIWKSIYSGITSLILENGKSVTKKKNRKNKN